MTSDPQVMHRINELVDEEHRLRARHDETPLGGEDKLRLDQIETELDRCWDLLNQRRALREFGMDPDQASARDDDTVEGYLQ